MKRGFTIIELLIAITIIGILIAAAGLKFTQARSVGRDAKRISDILLISKSIDSSVVNNGGVYPYLLASKYNDGPGFVVHSAVSCVREFRNDLPTNSFVNYSLDKSMFTGQIIPDDPNADTSYASSNGCIYPEQGYIYENHYINKTRWPSNPGSSSSSQMYSMAQVLNVNYLLDVSLENKQPEGSILHQYTNTQLTDSHSVYGSPFVNPLPLHFRYYFPGPYCGDQCYN